MQDLNSVFRDHVKEGRDRRGLTTEELSAFLGDLGVTMHATAITKLEKGQRGVSLQEAVGLALAVGVPLPLMLVPNSTDEDFAITPEVPMSPGRALNWLLRGEPALDAGMRWQVPNRWPITAFHNAVEAHHEAITAGNIAWNFEREGKDAAGARHRYHVRLVDLRRALDVYRGEDWGLEGFWSNEFADDLASLEAQADGAPPEPIYGGFSRRSDDPEED